MFRKPNFFIVMLVLSLVMSACAPAKVEAPAVIESPAADLDGIKTYLLEKSSALTSGSQALKDASDRYFALAKASGFDYAALWAASPKGASGSSRFASTSGPMKPAPVP